MYAWRSWPLTNPLMFQNIYTAIIRRYHYFDRLPKNRPIIVADAVGLRSKEVVIFLIDNGFTIIANLVGGITDWEKDGLPMVVDNKQRLTGSCMCQLRAWGKKGD